MVVKCRRFHQTDGITLCIFDKYFYRQVYVHNSTNLYFHIYGSVALRVTENRAFLFLTCSILYLVCMQIRTHTCGTYREVKDKCELSNFYSKGD